jgi:hypothetical protein
MLNLDAIFAECRWLIHFSSDLITLQTKGVAGCQASLRRHYFAGS